MPQEEAFQNTKDLLKPDAVLVHYDRKPLVLGCDASSYEMGAVLSHIMEDGVEMLVAQRPELCEHQKKFMHRLTKKF